MNPKLQNLIDKAKRQYYYCSHGVWADTRPKFMVNLIKTLNITVKSFLSTDIQTQACAMTYRTLLALVPALALLFAIGRGFGLQSLLQDELYRIFPSQREVINHGLTFVDSYLNQASEGIFVGVGIIFLLYTIINLVSNVESSFDKIWNVRQGRSFLRKISDYSAMLLILPVLMICGAGFEMFLSTTLQQFFKMSFMTPVLSTLFEVASFFFTCLFFTGVFIMVPNTKVHFKNALLAGLFTGIGFTVLQWIFLTGQMYVAKYNAIYGSFSFLPLLLIWLQFVWVICLSGALICYASQNIFQFTFSDQINDISSDYNEKVTLAIASTIVKQFMQKQGPVTDRELTASFGIPSRLVTNVIDRLCDAKVVSKVVISEKDQMVGYQPAIDPNLITVNYLRIQLNTLGSSNFIPNFQKNFPKVVNTLDTINRDLIAKTADIKLQDL